LIDFGSLWDPFVGAVTRGYHGEIIQSCLDRSGARTAVSPTAPRVRTIAPTARRVRVGRFYPAPKRRYR
jgi:hypothetical protein